MVLLKRNRIMSMTLAAIMLVIPIVTLSGCSGDSGSSNKPENSNVVSELNLPAPGKYGIESNSWTTISDGKGGQQQVHIIHATDGNTYVIPYADTAMITVSAEQGTLIVASDDTEVGTDKAIPDRGEEVKKYQLLVPSREWEGRVQRGNGQYGR